VLLSPGAAADGVKALIEGGPTAAALPAGMAMKAWASLALWTLAPLAGALAWFGRQDLSKE
jgi:ABC-2 type transport system permease protein